MVTIQDARNRYKTESSILKRIEWCSIRPKHTCDLPALYAVLGEVRVRNRHKDNAKTAYNQSKLKRDRITKVRERVSLYEKNLKSFIEDRWLYVTVTPAAYKYYRFFFPIERMSPRGVIYPANGFTEEVALIFIDAFVKAESRYKMDYYHVLCKERWTGEDFIMQYNKGIDSYQKMFPGVPTELLYKLYNIRQAGSTAIGNGEYLMRLKIRDINKEKHGDLCTESGMNLEMKAAGGRLSCQVQSDVDTMDEVVKKQFSSFCHDCTMLDHGMIELYRIIKSNWGWNDKLNTGWTDRDIIKFFAKCKIETYSKYLSQPEKNLFVQNMAENWDAFFFDGKFTEKSVDWINACHDAYVYPRLEKWTHLKIDTKQPLDISHAKDFNVRFKVFDRYDFATPGLILRLLELGKIVPSGTIKNNGRDKAVHVDIR